MKPPVRHLALVLGDQLWPGNPVFDGFDPTLDRVLMIEASGEATGVWSHKARIALFLSAMRHFCNDLHRQGWPTTYVRLDEQPQLLSFQERLTQALRGLEPEMIMVCEPGEWRMLAAVQDAAREADVPLQVLPDRHFMCTREEFARWAGSKKELRMEFFYRDMRRRHGVLMQGREPVGGQWNFDADNRKGYPASGPGAIPQPAWFAPDRITRDVFALVEQHFPDHPGLLDSFQWPVTRAQALQALAHFVEVRLPHFGPQQDAMWTDTPWGWHALLASRACQPQGVSVHMASCCGPKCGSRTSTKCARACRAWARVTGHWKLSSNPGWSGKCCSTSANTSRVMRSGANQAGCGIAPGPLAG